MRFLVLLFICCVALTPALAADPFGGPAAPAASSETAGPSLMGGFMQRLAHEQMMLNNTISHGFREVSDTGSTAALATILSLSFLYGILHAVGPGHGKSVVASYFVANEARWTSGMVMGGAISLLQGLTAIVIVFLLSLVLHAKQLQVQDRGALIEFISYGLVAVIGAVMFWRGITGRGCAHDHGKIDLGRARHDHAHHDHAHDHGHAHHHHPAPAQGLNLQRLITIAAGLAPCASAIIIMLFALANDALTVGVAAVLALSLGMGITVSLIGVLSIVGRKFLQRLTSGPGWGAERIERGLAIAGSIAVMGFSGLLMLGAWDRL
jgi:ABC-type nickel/cobalt efflux system permease component RcnA